MDGLFIFYCLCLAISPLTNQLSAFLLLLLLLYQKALPALNNRLVTWSYTPVTIFFLSSRIVCLGSFHRMLLNSASASARSNWNFTQRTNHHFSLVILWHAPRRSKLRVFMGTRAGRVSGSVENVGPHRSATRHRSLNRTKSKASHPIMWCRLSCPATWRRPARRAPARFWF